ncbi:hypothetical protein [Parapedobacter sp.]
MQQHIPNISRDSLSEKDLEIFHSLDQVRYGEELAGRVAEKLKRMSTGLNENDHYAVSGLYHAHRDYCGTGLYFFDGKFTLGEVNDGMGPHPVLIVFESEQEFVSWLADQSDQGMSLYTRRSFNNQTITKMRLTWYLEDEYSPVWNSYCMYVGKQIT